jgi:hypothetical protein
MSTATAHRPTLTPAERVAASRRAQQLQSGEVTIPMACPVCFGSSIGKAPDEPGWKCWACLLIADELAAREDTERPKEELLDLIKEIRVALPAVRSFRDALRARAWGEARKYYTGQPS